jgi:hypothetical protein
MRIALVGLLCLVACGDDDSAPAECTPNQNELPTEGSYIDPYAIALPETCVVGGLRELPGRWFLRDPSHYFQFEYPKYIGDCVNGHRREAAAAEDHDASDQYKQTFYTWSDGTRYFERQAYEFDDGTPSGYGVVRASVTCMLPDHTLATTYVRFDTSFGERLFSAIGTRFGAKDDVATGIELVAELGAPQGAPIYGLNLIVEGNYAYVVGLGGLDVVDVSNPAAPVAVGHVNGYLNDVRIVHGAGKTVAIASSEGGDDRTWLIDVTTPTAPMFVSFIDAYSHSVQTRTVGATTELYLANYSEEIPRYDVTNPLAPIAAGKVTLPGETISGVHDLTVYGDRIYANNTDAGFVAVDVSAGLASPVQLGRTTSAYSHASWAGTINGREIVLHGDEGMSPSTDSMAFMRVLDGEPSSPTYLQDIGLYRTRAEVGIHNIEVHGTRAYISYYQDGVRVVELADPENPVEVAHYNTWNAETAGGAAFEGAVGLRKAGDYLYVADLERGLLILREL